MQDAARHESGQGQESQGKVESFDGGIHGGAIVDEV
jgi:hypothetical protein